MSKWRPIETAPKDNTRIISYGGGLVGTSRFVVKFATAYSSDSAGWYSEQLDRKHSPTHWMPLPKPPVDISDIT